MNSKRAGVLSVFASVLVLAAVTGLGACNGQKSPPVTPQSGEDSGTPTTPNTQNNPQDSGVSSDAGSDAGATTDGGVLADGGAVQCGTTTCSGSQQCCFLGLDAGTVAECRATCPGASIACDEASDCADATPFCCFTATLSLLGPACVPSSVSSACTGSCPMTVPPAVGCTGTARGARCETDDDCVGNGTDTFCCPVPLGTSGYKLNACGPVACP
jgi:hypothetical protein